MSFEDYQNYRDAAEEAQKSGEFTEAGHHFTSAAHEILGHAEYTQEPLERGQVDTIYGLRSMLYATLYYRVEGYLARCRVRGKQGILLAEELRDHVAQYDAQRGVMYEYIGDFELISETGDWRSSYDEADTYYRDIENVTGWRAEPEFEMNLGFMFELASEADFSIDKETKDDLKSSDLERRTAYKRSHYPEIISKRITSADSG